MKKFLYLGCFLAAISVGMLVPTRVSAQAATLMYGSNSGVPQVIKSTSGALWVSITGGSSTISTLSAADTTGIAMKSYLNPIDGTNFTPTLAGAGAGNVDNGVHSYKFTLTDEIGETTAGATTPTVTVVDKTANGKVSVKFPVLKNTSQVNSIKLYRTAAGGSTYLFLAEISGPFTGLYTDNIADASLGAAPPSTNTAFDTRYTLIGENLVPTTGSGNGLNGSAGNFLILGHPVTDTQRNVGIAVHDAFTPTSNGVDFNLYSGNSRGGTAGQLNLVGGTSVTSSGGAINISGGAGSTAANSGKVTITSASQVLLGGGNAATKVTDGGSNYGAIDALSYQLSGSLLCSTTAPTRASGFGTNNDASFATGSNTCAFDMNIGTGGAPTSGVLTMPTAAHGWICHVHDATTITDNTYQSAYTVSSVTFTTTVAWSGNDHLYANCMGF